MIVCSWILRYIAKCCIYTRLGMCSKETVKKDNYQMYTRDSLVQLVEYTGCLIASDTSVFPYFSIMSNNRTLTIWFSALCNMQITHEASYFSMALIKLISCEMKKIDLSQFCMNQLYSR